MKIEERILRGEQEDVIEIGQTLETFYNSDAGAIFRALANAIITKQFTDTQDNNTSSDKKLGRAEGVTLLITDIEIAIDNMRRFTAPIKEE